MLRSSDRSSANPPSLSYAVIEAVAEEEGIDATEVEPPEYEALYNVVNPESLDTLFAAREDGSTRECGHVEFRFCGYDVSISSDGQVEVS